MVQPAATEQTQPNTSTQPPSQTAITNTTANKVVPLIDPKYDWYQNATHVFISYKVANSTVSEQTEITFDSQVVTLTYPSGELSLTLHLSNPIVAELSTKSTSAKKIELKLKK
jgi:hypothetical protein